MRIQINEDIENREFRENFFYHFTKKETAYIGASMAVGGAVYLLCLFLGLHKEQTTLVMAVCVAPVLLTGFYKKQGFGFRDYIRKWILLRMCSTLVWESTEEPYQEGTAKLRIKNIREGRKEHGYAENNEDA